MTKIKIKNASNKVATFTMKNQVLEIETFFIEDNPSGGICTKESFKEYLSTLDSNELFNLEYFFNNIADNSRVNISPKIYKDRFGTDYVYVNIYYKNGGGEKFKVTCFEGFEKFRTALKTQGVRIRFSEIIENLGIELDFEEEQEEVA